MWKWSKNVVKNIVKNCVKNFVKNVVPGPPAEPFWSAEEFLTVFWPGCLQPFLGGDAVCDSWGHFHGIVSTDEGVCISPTLASRFLGWSTSVYTGFWISLASLPPLCPCIVLIQSGNWAWKPLTFCPFRRVSKKCQKFKFVFHAVLLQTPPR